MRAIQTRTYYGFDNRYLCDSASAHPDWVCGVVTLDPDDPRAPRFCGVRCASRRKVAAQHPSGAHRTFDNAGVRALWRVAAKEGITIDLFLMEPEMVESAATLLGEFPQLTAGFCHCMDLKPGPDLAENLQVVLGLSRFASRTQRAISSPQAPRWRTPAPTPRPSTSQSSRRTARIAACGEVATPTSSGRRRSLRRAFANFTEALPLTDGEKRLILGENARRIWFPEMQG